MKRYRILNFDFDSRAYMLSMEIRDEWEEVIKEQHRENKKRTQLELIQEYGSNNPETKAKNFIDLGKKPISVVAFHNRFFE